MIAKQVCVQPKQLPKRGRERTRVARPSPSGLYFAVQEGKGQYCINCDNKHGCKSGTPPCLAEMAKHGVNSVSGKGYLIDAGRIFRCKPCAFFRSCWDVEEYGWLSREEMSRR